MKPNPAKIKAIRKFPRSTTVGAIRQFLGLSGYYRKFIQDYAELAKPLSNLLKKDVKWKWGNRQKRIFRRLRRYLCREPILLYPPVKKRNEFEKLKKALEQLEVIWNNAPRHNGIEGNEAANRLVREGIEGRALFSSESEEDADEEFDMDTLKRDLQKTFSQFKKTVGREGLDISNINPDSLY